MLQARLLERDVCMQACNTSAAPCQSSQTCGVDHGLTGRCGSWRMQMYLSGGWGQWKGSARRGALCEAGRDYFVGVRHELDVDEQAQALLAPLRKGQAVEARLPPRSSSARTALPVRDPAACPAPRQAFARCVGGRCRLDALSTACGMHAAGSAPARSVKGGRACEWPSWR